jgi:hypothetical protein
MSSSRGWNLDALLNVLTGPGKFIYSLYFPRLDEMVQTETKKLESFKDMRVPDVVENPASRKQTFGKKTLGGRL